MASFTGHAPSRAHRANQTLPVPQYCCNIAAQFSFPTPIHQWRGGGSKECDKGLVRCQCLVGLPSSLIPPVPGAPRTRSETSPTLPFLTSSSVSASPKPCQLPLAFTLLQLEIQSCETAAATCAASDWLLLELKPVIVVSINQDSSQKTLVDWIDSFQPPKDDVFSKGFLTDKVMVKGNAQDSQRVQDAWPTLSPNPVTGSWAPSQVLLVATPERDTPNSSYFLGPGLQLYQA